MKQKQRSARCGAGQDRRLGFQDHGLMTPFLPMHSGVTGERVNTQKGLKMVLGIIVVF